MAVVAGTQSNSESVVNLAVLRFTTDAAAAAATSFTLGFIPRVVRLENITDLLKDEWIEGMSANQAIHTVAAGTRTLSTGITVNSDGTITIAAALLIASKTFNMVCEG